MKGFEVINGSDIKKEIPSNNNKYIKLNNHDFDKLKSLRFIDSRIGFNYIQNDRMLTLDLPKIRDKKLVNEPAFKTMEYCLLTYGFWKYQGVIDNIKYKKRFENQTLEVEDYQNEIIRQDLIIEELQNEINHYKSLIQEVK
jgi:hypothetical protein